MFDTIIQQLVDSAHLYPTQSYNCCVPLSTRVWLWTYGATLKRKGIVPSAALGLVEVPHHLAVVAKAFTGTTNDVVKTNIESSATTSSDNSGVFCTLTLVLPLCYGDDDICGRACCTWLKGCSPVH